MEDSAENKIEIAKPSEPKLAAILEILSSNAGEVISRDELISRVWEDAGSDEALNQSISKIRKHLGKFNSSHVLETVPRQGYRVKVRIELEEPIEVSHSMEQGFQQVSEKATLLAENTLLHQKNKFLRRLSIALGLIAAVLLGYIFYHNSQHVKIIKVGNEPVTLPEID